MKKILCFLLSAILIFALVGCDSQEEPKESHSNCMFIGYADPNRPLNGNSHCTLEPQYGYKPVYIDRDDTYPYTTYHFH